MAKNILGGRWNAAAEEITSPYLQTDSYLDKKNTASQLSDEELYVLSTQMARAATEGQGVNDHTMKNVIYDIYNDLSGNTSNVFAGERRSASDLAGNQDIGGFAGLLDSGWDALMSSGGQGIDDMLGDSALGQKVTAEGAAAALDTAASLGLFAVPMIGPALGAAKGWIGAADEIGDAARGYDELTLERMDNEQRLLGLGSGLAEGVLSSVPGGGLLRTAKQAGAATSKAAADAAKQLPEAIAALQKGGSNAANIAKVNELSRIAAGGKQGSNIARGFKATAPVSSKEAGNKASKEAFDKIVGRQVNKNIAKGKADVPASVNIKSPEQFTQLQNALAYANRSPLQQTIAKLGGKAANARARVGNIWGREKEMQRLANPEKFAKMMNPTVGGRIGNTVKRFGAGALGGGAVGLMDTLAYAPEAGWGNESSFSAGSIPAATRGALLTAVLSGALGGRGASSALAASAQAEKNRVNEYGERDSSGEEYSEEEMQAALDRLIEYSLGGA